MAISQIENASLATGVPSSAKLPAGTVLQVVQTFYKTTETYTSTSFTATGVSASITPTASTSKILVQVMLQASGTSDTYGGFRLYRNGSEVTGATSNAGTGSSTNAFIQYTHRDTDASYELATFSNAYLDSPASTSAQTYTIYCAMKYGAAIKINGTYTVDTGNTYTTFAPSSITLIEVAA